MPSTRNTPDVMTRATWALAAALAVIVSASLIDGPSDFEAAQDVADEAAYAAAQADGGTAQCAALGRTAIMTPEGHLICRLPAPAPTAPSSITLAQGGQP